MASLSDYIKQLTSDYASNNIYSTLGNSFLQTNLNVSDNPWVNLATNLAKGFVGGGLNRMGLEDVRDYQRGAASMFSEGLSGRPITRPEGLSDSDTNSILSSLSLWKTARDNEVAQTMQDIGIEGIKNRVVEKAKIQGQNEGWGYSPDLTSVDMLGGGRATVTPTNPSTSNTRSISPVDLTSIFSTTPALLPLLKANEPTPVPVETRASAPSMVDLTSVFANANPNSPQYKVAEKQLDLANNRDSILQNINAQLTSPSGLGGQYSNIRPLIPTIEKLAFAPSSTFTDISLIKAAAKIDDPAGSVMGDDVRTSTEAQGFLTSLFGDWKNAINDEGKLTEKSKMILLKNAASRVNEVGKAYEENLYTPQIKRAELAGVDPSLIAAVKNDPYNFESFIQTRLVGEYKNAVKSLGSTDAARAYINNKYGSFLGGQ